MGSVFVFPVLCRPSTLVGNTTEMMVVISLPGAFELFSFSLHLSCSKSTSQCDGLSGRRSYVFYLRPELFYLPTTVFQNRNEAISDGWFPASVADRGDKFEQYLAVTCWCAAKPALTDF